MKQRSKTNAQTEAAVPGSPSAFSAEVPKPGTRGEQHPSSFITCGIDIGARTVKALLYNSESKTVLGYKIENAGVDPVNRAQGVFHALLGEMGLTPADVRNTVATGYGRKSFPHAVTSVTEITCHARGTVFHFPEARTVIDVGGQDSKAIAMDRKGNVKDFVMNDRCAAGTGRFLEMTADTLKIPLDAMGRLALQAKKTIEINSMCAVFAESEIIGLLSKGCPREDIVRGVIDSISKRLAVMAGKIGIKEKAVFTGGVAKNPGMVRALENDLKIKLIIPEEPRITGALGAALIAAEKRPVKSKNTAKRGNEKP